MECESLSLAWQDHHSSLVALVKMLLENNSLVDCTLAAEGKYMKAHKVILSACSPYFQLLFNQESEKNPIVILKDVKYEYLEFIIDFIYRGKVKLCHTQLNDFLELAKSLQIRGLNTCREDQNSESTNSEAACTGAREESQQTEKLSTVDEEKDKEDCEIIDNVDMTDGLHNTAVPTSQKEQEEPEEDGDEEEVTLTIESTYSIATGASCGNSAPDDHQWSLPIELPGNLPPRSPSALTDHSVDTVIMVHPDDETFEPETDVKKEDCGDSCNECSRTQLKDSPESCNEDTPVSSCILSRGSTAINIAEAIKKNGRLNPRVYLNKLNVNSLTQTWKPSKSQVQDNGSRITEGISTETISAGRELSSTSQSILTTEQCSELQTTLHDPSLERSPSELSPISPKSSNSKSSESSTVGIRKRVSLMKTHTRTPAKKYKCPRCLKSFLHDNELANHMKLHSDSTDKPYQCPQCLKGFIRRKSISTHMMIHEGVRPYQCLQCLKRFSQAGNLASHMRIHTGERPFKCPQCPKSFSHSVSLTDHVRIHTGEKPFKCKVCKKQYSRRSTLKIHLRTHTGERPYECEHCGKKFSCNSNLWAHRNHYMKYV